MSGTSARESYRSGKRTRTSNSQASRMTPPVLFRLPSVAMPEPDLGPSASTAGAAAMAIPMTSAVGLATGVAATSASVSAATSGPAPSVPAQAAAQTMTAEKAAGQRILNTLIVALLLLALAIIAWITVNRVDTAPSMADNDSGHDTALDTLGDLKVPAVSTNPVATVTPEPANAPSSPSVNLNGSNAESLMAEPADSKTESTAESTASRDSESLLSLDTSGIDASVASTQTAQPNPTASSATASTSTDSPNVALTAPIAEQLAPNTAQIQLRPAVPLGGSSLTSLVDAQKPANQLGAESLGSSSGPSFDTVSTPSKVFPATIDPARNSESAATATTDRKSNESSGNSPTLYDGAQKAPEGLQLSQSDANAGNTPNPSSPSALLNISKPLSKEIAVSGAKSTTNDGQLAQQSTSTDPKPGVTVGAGAEEPYGLQNNTPASQPTRLATRADLDPSVLAKIYVSGAAKGAVSGTTTRLNSYSGAVPTKPGQNLYETNATSSVAAGLAATSGGPINSFAGVPNGNVPTGITNNGSGSYLPPAGSMATATTPVNQYVNSQNPAGQYQPGQYQPGQYQPNPYSPTQFASGPASVPASPAGYSVPPRGAATYGQPTASNANMNQSPSNQVQMPAYTPQATSGFGTSGSGFPNMTYPTPTTGYQPAGGQPNTFQPNSYQPNTYQPNTYQAQASYPGTRSPSPGGQVPSMMGPSGFATAPTSDFAPKDVMGKAGMATSLPYGTPQ